jgi:hypothetical protein
MLLRKTHEYKSIRMVQPKFWERVQRLMSKTVLVKIIGAPVACQRGIKETWREVAGWAAEQLRSRYGETVRVQYYDLFDPDCPTLPPGSQLPVVFVGEALVSSGGKISIPLIRKKIEEPGGAL